MPGVNSMICLVHKATDVLLNLYIMIIMWIFKDNTLPLSTDIEVYLHVAISIIYTRSELALLAHSFYTCM